MARTRKQLEEQAKIDVQNEEQLANAESAMQDIQAIEEQTRIMQQEEQNKTHDTEFTKYGGTDNEEVEVDEFGDEVVTSYDVIGELEVREAFETLMKYKEEKSMLEARITENEEFWKLKHWDVMYKAEGKAEDYRIKPKSAWLFNTIINKHADAMDNFPEANILPRTLDDEDTAKVLSQVVPVILEQNDYEKTYSDAQWYKAKNGTSVQGVFWNNDKNDGLGDVEIKKIDILNLYWKGGIDNIQDSPNVFHVTMMDNEEIEARYPDLKDVKSGGLLPVTSVSQYRYDDRIDYSEQSPVVDWYYKRRVQTVDNLGVPQMKTVLHYCKFVNGQVIYASENDPNFADRGWYDHGKYPFVFDALFPVESSVCGMGYIDTEKDNQLYIDKLQQGILENVISTSRPRYAVRQDSNLNEEEFLDTSKPLVHFDGNLGEEAFRQIVASPLSGIAETVYLQKVQEMKDTSGNTASSQGQASAVTSASGIASLQEAAGKLSRDSNNASFRAFKEVVYLVIELIRQFYTEPRCFRISGEFGHNEFVELDNSGLQPKSLGQSFGIDLGSRLPIMDIEVKPQKKSAYSKESQNQTALNLYQMGFFAPNNADASLACLEMMEFDNVEKIKERVSQNGTLMQMVMQLQAQLMQMGAIVDAQNGTNLAPQVAEEAEQTQNNGAKTGGGSVKTSRGSLSSQAADATRNSTAPRG